MKIIFVIPLILFLIISALLFTGHSGVAEKVSQVAFFLALGVIIWGLAKVNKEKLEGKEGLSPYAKASGDKEGLDRGKNNFQRVLFFLGFVVPYLLIYKAFFVGGPLAFGDAPFFNPENLKELFNPPFLWNFKDNNFGSTQYHILWLYLPTYIYGLLNNFLGLSNDILIRFVFYFPATILAIFGAWKFIGEFNQNIWGKFLGSFLYGFNTYFLMILDGGQVGIALAYGLFPITSLSILGYLSNPSLRSFIFAVLGLFALVSADIRIAVISVVFTSLVWGVREVREIGECFKRFLFLWLAVLWLNAFWVLPTLFSLGNLSNLGNLSDGNNFINITNSLFLYQPHFPLNEFGRIFSTPFYFVLLPILIFGSLFLNNGKILREKLFLVFLFLIFAFLAKGGSEPFGSFYSRLITLPGGVAFRDFSKFYMPLILLGSVLISFTVSGLERVVKKKEIKGIIVVGVYIYLLVLIYPALLGNLSGVLGGKEELEGLEKYQQIVGRLNKEQGFFRTLYFEEKPAAAYFTWEKPALSANNLYQERPFASLITGKYDLYNFLHSPQIKQWLNLLGVRYVFFPENERKKIWSVRDQQERKEFLDFIETVPGLQRLNWQTNFPAYEVTGQATPHIFGMKKAYFVIGGEDVYQPFFKSPNFSLKNQGFIFLEDGKVDLDSIKNIDPKSLEVIFYKKDLLDLQMGYFVQNMVSVNQSQESQWKIYGTSDYLTWKYESLKNGIDSKEFDYGKGVALSTIPGEKINFKITANKPGNYFLAVRFTNDLEGSIKIHTLGQEFKLQNKNPQSFKWEVIGPMRREGSNVEIEIENEGNFALLNTLALIHEEQLEATEDSVRDLTEKYETFFIRGEKEGMGDWGDIGKENIISLNYEQVNPTQYQLTNLPDYPLWIVFSDHYHPGWDLEGARQFSFYAMINGFYLNRPQKDGALIFTPQKGVYKGVFLSALSFGIIVLTLIYILVKEVKRKRKG